MAQEMIDRLEVLYHINKTIHSSLEMDVVLNLVMDEVIAATRAERGFLMLRAPDGEMAFQVARGMDQQTVAAPEFEVSRTVVSHVIDTGQAWTDADWTMDTESMKMIGVRSIMCIPMQTREMEEVIGLIYVDSRVQHEIFNEDDRKLLTAIAADAVGAIENARLHQIALEKERMEREQQDARQLQISLLPQRAPRLDGWEFATCWYPAHEVSGDFYDFIPLNDGRTGVVLADVSDKGMAAAMFMAISRNTVRGSVAQHAAPADCIRQANRLICADSLDDMFVSLFYLEMTEQGDLEYVNAGHNPPLLYQAACGEVRQLERTGMVLGLFDDVDYAQAALTMAPGDCLLLYTDGLTESVNASLEEFGLDRVCEVLLQHIDSSAEEAVGALEAALAQFTGAVDQFDDITLVLIKFL
jgi:sigma-B regulation protein RsbU (phosphoserine phosphatase)